MADKKSIVEIKKNVPISEIKPYEKNYQNHDINLEHIKNSIKDFDFDVPIVVDVNNVIVKGHGRYEALKELGKDTIPFVAINKALDTEKKASAARIADNESSKAAVIDNDLLQIELDLIGEDFDMIDYGLDLENLDVNILEPEETEGDDDLPESAPPITVLGDVYELGGVHRVMCGDSTMIDDVEKLMDGKKADISFTSPPYNVGSSALLDGNTHMMSNKYNSYNDSQTSQNYLDLLVSFTKNALLNCEYLICNIQSLAGNKITLIDYINHFKNNFIDVAIWDKGHGTPAMAENVMNSAWEYLIFISSKDKPSRSIPNANFRGTVPNIFRGNPQRNNEFSKIHSATFPIELCEWALQFTNIKNIILDLFLGTGSTLIACEKTNRKCYGMELDPKYCDVIVKRYVDFCKKNNKPYSIFRNGQVCKDFE